MDLDIDPAGSVEQFFEPLIIRQLLADYANTGDWFRGDLIDGRFVEQDAGPLKMWLVLKPDGSVPKAKYVGGVDVSTGTGATPSVMTIANAHTGEKVLEYTRYDLSPDEFAVVCVQLCCLFRDEDGEPTFMAWECPGPGTNFGKKVLDLRYRNVYMHEYEGRLKGQPATTFGWHSSVEGKRDMLLDYATALKKRQFLNRSREALEECLLFKYDAVGAVVYAGKGSKKHGSRRPSGVGVNHGDHVIADALAWKLAKRLYRGPKEVVEKREAQVGSLAWRRLLHERAVERSGWD
jgi:hypothetical protein